MKILIADYHIGTQIWQKAIIDNLNDNHIVNIQSLSGHSRYIGGETKNKIILKIGAMFGGPTGSWNDDKTKIIKELFTDDELKETFDHDIVISSFPPAMFEAYQPFNQMKIIINMGHRFHLNCYPEELNNNYINKLQNLSKSDNHIVASMSKYDCEYLKHYTDIDAVPLYVSCFHLSDQNHYKPTSNTILIGPAHCQRIFPFTSIEEMNKLSSDWASKHKIPRKLDFAHLKSQYSEYNFSNLGLKLGNHKAIVIFPYSVFSMSMIEIYESNIPFFVPSIDILIQNKAMTDRVMFPIYCTENEMSKIDVPHKNSPHKYSPNSYNIDDEKYWLQFCYFYQQKNVIIWTSPEDLIKKLYTLNLKKISNKMYAENMQNRKIQLQNWMDILF